MTFRFGQVVSMDYEPEMRVLVLARDPDAGSGLHPAVWKGIVLADATWPVGLVVTVAPDIAGVVVIEEGRGGA